LHKKGSARGCPQYSHRPGFEIESSFFGKVFVFWQQPWDFVSPKGNTKYLDVMTGQTPDSRNVAVFSTHWDLAS
jgi:hypothetical protein